MFGAQEIETIRAALLYWQEEMSPHADETGRPYFERAEVRPLLAADIDKLRAELASCVRYAIYEPVGQQLLSTVLWTTAEEAISQAGGKPIATVLLPSPSGA